MRMDYMIVDGQCYKCRTDEDVVMDEDGDFICTDCLFEKTCDEMFNFSSDDDEIDWHHNRFPS